MGYTFYYLLLVASSDLNNFSTFLFWSVSCCLRSKRFGRLIEYMIQWNQINAKTHNCYSFKTVLFVEFIPFTKIVLLQYHK